MKSPIELVSGHEDLKNSTCYIKSLTNSNYSSLCIGPYLKTSNAGFSINYNITAKNSSF